MNVFRVLLATLAGVFANAQEPLISIPINAGERTLHFNLFNQDVIADRAVAFIEANGASPDLGETSIICPLVHVCMCACVCMRSHEDGFVWC